MLNWDIFYDPYLDLQEPKAILSYESYKSHVLKTATFITLVSLCIGTQ